MTTSSGIIEDQYHRGIDCPGCEREPSKLQAWVDINGLDRMEVESIVQLGDDDVWLLAKFGEGGVLGACAVCGFPQQAHQPLVVLGGGAPDMAEIQRRRPELATNTSSFQEHGK